MMKYLLIALAVTAISANTLADDSSLDEFLETESEMGLPCTPKPCTPVCKLVTKSVMYGSYKMEYKENECKPDHKCLAAAAACQKKLMAAMIHADKTAKALEAASKAKNAAHASHAAKVKAANAKKAEAAAAKNSMGLAKAAFVAAEKDAANAKAAKESATKLYAAKAKVMDARLKDYEKAMQAHKNAVAAYDGAKSAAAKAAAAYAAAVKVHCDAEAQHAAAVRHIGHGNMAQKKCAAWFKIADNKKCPYKHGHRIAKFTKQTLHSCGAKCKAKAGCVGFSVKTASGQYSGDCMLCKATSPMDNHAGFNFYEMAK